MIGPIIPYDSPHHTIQLRSAKGTRCRREQESDTLPQVFDPGVSDSTDGRTLPDYNIQKRQYTAPCVAPSNPRGKNRGRRLAMDIMICYHCHCRSKPSIVTVISYHHITVIISRHRSHRPHRLSSHHLSHRLTVIVVTIVTLIVIVTTVIVPPSSS